MGGRKGGGADNEKKEARISPTGIAVNERVDGNPVKFHPISRCVTKDDILHSMRNPSYKEGPNRKIATLHLSEFDILY